MDIRIKDFIDSLDFTQENKKENEMKFLNQKK